MKKSPLLRSISEYERYRRSTLNLIPSENLLSREVLGALSSSMNGRYAGRPESYGGTDLFHRVWDRAEGLAREVFECQASSVSPISGHLAGMMVLDTLCARGEKVAVISKEDGGYQGYNEGFIPSVLGLRTISLPFDRERRNLDLEGSIHLLRREKPDLVVLGATVFLFPHPVTSIADEVHSYGGRVVYDGSHVLGLVAGGEFQDPLGEGADFLIGSTHKTFFGPQGGIILSNDAKLLRRVEERFLYRFMDNFHLSRVAALGVALEEMKLHGRRYARQVVANSYELASRLASQGLPVACEGSGFTRSHQVLLSYPNGTEVRKKLEKAKIIVDSRVRLGTNEVTRRGMEQRDMAAVAGLVSEGLNSKDQSRVARRVTRFVSGHNRIRYTLND